MSATNCKESVSKIAPEKVRIFKARQGQSNLQLLNQKRFESSIARASVATIGAVAARGGRRAVSKEAQDFATLAANNWVSNSFQERISFNAAIKNA
jgi:hypothetical protein